MENQGVPRVIVFVLLGVILLFIFGSRMFVTINPGQKGVLFETLGDGLDKETNDLYKIPINTMTGNISYDKEDTRHNNWDPQYTDQRGSQSNRRGC